MIILIPTFFYILFFYHILFFFPTEENISLDYQQYESLNNLLAHTLEDFERHYTTKKSLYYTLFHKKFPFLTATYKVIC